MLELEKTRPAERGETLYNESLLRWGGGVYRGRDDKMAPEVGGGMWVLWCSVCASLLFCFFSLHLYVLGVHSISFAVLRGGGRAFLKTSSHAHVRVHDSTHSAAANMRGVELLKHWHFPVTAGLEGMVAADCCCCRLLFV